VAVYAHSVEGHAEERWSLCPIIWRKWKRKLLRSRRRSGLRQWHWPWGCSTISANVRTPIKAIIRRPRDTGGPKGPDHSTAGAKEAIAAYGEQFGKLMAFGIAGHHSGLTDGSGHEGGTPRGGVDRNAAAHLSTQTAAMSNLHRRE
jgi:CRISPR-associated endonuclease/helicase Cas3